MLLPYVSVRSERIFETHLSFNKCKYTSYMKMVPGSTVLVLLLLYSTMSFADPKKKLGTIDPLCLEEDTFYCLDGTCRKMDKYCDGKVDCPDGSDENFCAYRLPNAARCHAPHDFLCNDLLKCVPSYWVCNGEQDCDDGSDEVDCTPSKEPTNMACSRGFQCDNGRCISKLWMCDGKYDCKDKSDESIKSVCRHVLSPRRVNNGKNCLDDEHPCLDQSYCVPSNRMCDNIEDCRDGSDEGAFCKSWSSMCKGYKCATWNGCTPSRDGPKCYCGSTRFYNTTSRRCELYGCSANIPRCSHQCTTTWSNFYICSCDPGYTSDITGYLCFAPEIEAKLFFSSRNDIRYINVKSRRMVHITNTVKRAHGVTFDGKYVYWVESAQGHQAIYRAHINKTNTKQVVVAFGLEEPSDLALDHYGGNLYFGDTQRHAIFVCKMNGSMCILLEVGARSPKFLTLNHRKGEMYWSDWHNKPVILMANMDGTKPDTLIQDLVTYPTGLAVDAPNDRLYFVDETIKAIRFDTRAVYTLFKEPFHRPFALAVFENTVYWSDWTSKSVKTFDKVHVTRPDRRTLVKLDYPVFDMHIYHPLLMTEINNQCSNLNQNCSHFCLLSGGTSYACACPDGMRLIGEQCKPSLTYRQRYLIVGTRDTFTRIDLSRMSSPDLDKYELVNTSDPFIQAMAFDSLRNILYFFDGRQRSLSFLDMKNFNKDTADGGPMVLTQDSSDNVVDMDFDFVSNSLYLLDSGKRVIEVVSVWRKMKAFVAFFKEDELPLSICVIPHYGMLLVAVLDESTDVIIIESMGLDGSHRNRFNVHNINSTYVRLRYSPDVDLVFFSDDSRKVIEQIHPSGTNRKIFRKLGTSVANLAVTGQYVFWTDRHTSRLYWADAYDTPNRIRRVELSKPRRLAPLLLVASTPVRDIKPYASHPCFEDATPCSHLCVQTYHPTKASVNLGYQCLCPKGLLIDNNKCVQKIKCGHEETYCHKSNTCVSNDKMCDGVKNCRFGEDEEGCVVPIICPFEKKECYGKCIPQDAECIDPILKCTVNEVRCGQTDVCLERSMMCDDHIDCPDGSDENDSICASFTCQEDEFKCRLGTSCIPKVWRCDRSIDCVDGSDEYDCDHSSCGVNNFQCYNGQCIDLKLRCNQQPDCTDYSDEVYCETTNPSNSTNAPFCPPWEFKCVHNRSMCVLFTTVCNGIIDCPGGTDEDGCDSCAPNHQVACASENKCLSTNVTCDGKKDCTDGSDETYDACVRASKSDSPFAKIYENGELCSYGYRCSNAHCVEWHQVCDGSYDCFDGTDEGGNCETACDDTTCDHECRPTPRGPQCFCRDGFELVEGKCQPQDPCMYSVCSHICTSKAGRHQCSCHPGYTLRADQSSCMLELDRLTVVYAVKAVVMRAIPDQKPEILYQDPDNQIISDISYNIQKKKAYLASRQGRKLIQLNLVNYRVDVITDIGIPAKIAVDWVSDNVYVQDEASFENKIRVCHFEKEKCAVLTIFSNTTKLGCIGVDPLRHRLFYHLRDIFQGVMMSSDLTGNQTDRLAPLLMCSGITIDTLAQNIYISQMHSGSILRLSYNGETFIKVVNDAGHPFGLGLYEDYVYYTNSTSLMRCKPLSNESCELYAPIQTNVFVIYHNVFQPGDVENQCDEYDCVNVCVRGDDGPVCVCPNGDVAENGQCNNLTDFYVSIKTIGDLIPKQKKDVRLIDLKEWKTVVGVLVLTWFMTTVLIYVFKSWTRTIPRVQRPEDAPRRYQIPNLVQIFRNICGYLTPRMRNTSSPTELKELLELPEIVTEPPVPGTGRRISVDAVAQEESSLNTSEPKDVSKSQLNRIDDGWIQCKSEPSSESNTTQNTPPDDNESIKNGTPDREVGTDGSSPNSSDMESGRDN